MLNLDAYAYQSVLARENPWHKVLLTMLPLLICLWADSWLVSLTVLLAMGGGIFCWTEVGWQRYGKLLAIPLAFLLLSGLTISFTRHGAGEELLLALAVGDSRYGVAATDFFGAMRLIMRSLAAVSCMYLLILTTPLQDLLWQLRCWHVPQLLLDLMAMMYRYIFVLLEEGEKIHCAQHSRLGYGSWRMSVQSFGQLAAMLFLRAWQRCDRIYDGLQSRGYDDRLNTLEQEYEQRSWLVCLALGFAAGLLLLAVVEKGWLG